MISNNYASKYSQIPLTDKVNKEEKNMNFKSKEVICDEMRMHWWFIENELK